MADTGAPYFIPYVEPTDLVRDYPAANEAMALAIVAALEDIPVTIKKVDAFTGDGTFTVPAGVTYAIAYVLGGGGGSGRNGSAHTAGGNSSVAFASGTITSTGGNRQTVAETTVQVTTGSANGRANSGQAPTTYIRSNAGGTAAAAGSGDSTTIVAGAAVTPAATIAVVVGAGGSAGQGGAVGGSGYVYIEYFEEV